MKSIAMATVLVFTLGASCDRERAAAQAPGSLETSPVDADAPKPVPTLEPQELSPNPVAPLEFGQPLPKDSFRVCSDDNVCKEAPVFEGAKTVRPYTKDGVFTGVGAKYAGGTLGETLGRVEKQLGMGLVLACDAYPPDWTHFKKCGYAGKRDGFAVAVMFRGDEESRTPSGELSGDTFVSVHSADAGGVPMDSAPVQLYLEASIFQAAALPPQTPYFREPFVARGLEYEITGPTFEGELGTGDRKFSAPDGIFLIVVRFTVRNPGDVPVEVSETPLWLEGPEGERFEISEKTELLARTEGLNEPGELPPGAKRERVAVFEAPMATVATPKKPAALVIPTGEGEHVRLEFYNHLLAYGVGKGQLTLSDLAPDSEKE